MKNKRFTVRNVIYNLPEIYASSHRGSIDDTIQLVDIMDLINKLDKRNRFILLRKYFYGDTTAQIAKRLSIAPKTVEGAVTRSMDRLDVLYNRQMAHDGY